MRMLFLLSFLLLKASPSCAGAYTYHSVYDYGLSTDQLSWVVIGSLLAFGIFLVAVILVCRQCGCCGYPQATGRGSPARPDTRPFHIHVAVIDTQRIGAFQHSPDENMSPQLPGLPPYARDCLLGDSVKPVPPPYARDCLPGDSAKPAPPPYTVEAEPWCGPEDDRVDLLSLGTE